MEKTITKKYFYKDGSTSNVYDIHKDLHRLDGPAVEHTIGLEAYWVEYLVNGKYIRITNLSKEDIPKYLKTLSI